MKNLTLTTLALLLSSLPALAGGSSTVGPGNPAAYFCVDAGGTLVNVDTEAGQDALCQFEGGGALNQWTFFRAKGKGSEQAVEVFFHPKAAATSLKGNPASLYCLAQGGNVKIAEPRDGGGQIGLCEFADRSTIEEWTLFRGANSPSNSALVKALQ